MGWVGYITVLYYRNATVPFCSTVHHSQDGNYCQVRRSCGWLAEWVGGMGGGRRRACRADNLLAKFANLFFCLFPLPAGVRCRRAHTHAQTTCRACTPRKEGKESNDSERRDRGVLYPIVLYCNCSVRCRTVTRRRKDETPPTTSSSHDISTSRL